MADVLTRQGKFGHRNTKEGDMKEEEEAIVLLPQAKECLKDHKLEEARMIPIQRLWREHSPADTLISAQASRTAREVVLSHQVHGTALLQTQEALPLSLLPLWYWS